MQRLAAAVFVAVAFAALVRVQADVATQAAGLVVQGFVVSDETGEPLVHARVTIYNDALPLPPIFTDAKGAFSSPPLPVGRYRLVVRKTGYTQTSIARLGAAPATVRLPRSASISGRIVDAFGDPIIGMAVSIMEPRLGATGLPSGNVVKSATTNDLGEYRVGGLPAGTYVAAIHTVSIDSTSGEVQPTLSYYPAVATIGDAQQLNLTPGEDRSGIDFNSVTTPVSPAIVSQLLLQPGQRVFGPSPLALAAQAAAEPAGAGAIRGRVTRADGLAVARATVTTAMQQVIANGGPRLGPKTTTTDESGQYEFTGLPRGGYRVTVAKSGFISSTYGQRDDDRGQTIELDGTETRTQIDIVLHRFSAIVGEVRDDFGDPVEGATVSVYQMRFQGGRRRLVGVNGTSVQPTDDLGRYRVYGLPPGQYIVSAAIGQVATVLAAASVSGFAPTYFPGTINAAEARLVTVERSQDLVGVDIALVPEPTARVAGIKLGSDGEPLGGSLVLTPSERSGSVVTAPTGARIEADGRFEFPNVAPGEYVIQADRGRTQSNAEGEFVAQFVSVAGADVTGLKLLATPGSTVRGHVTFDGDGAAPPPTAFAIVPARADLDLTPLSNGSIARAEVQPNLTFEVTGIHGPRRLVLDRAPAGWELKAVLVSGVDVTDTVLPFGTREQSLDDVEVVITNHVTDLNGTVSDSAGPIQTADYAVLVFPTDRDRWYSGSRYFRRVGARAGGTFRVQGLPAGDYYVAVVPGFRGPRNDDSWQDPDFLDSLAPRAARATLTEGQRVSVSARVITP